jgi:small subunit ribosomal protein S2
MRTITLEELLEAGSHFGHQVTRHNPKSRDYVFEARDNIHIIDLAKTKESLEEAARYVKSVSEKGGSIIILGAKRQADAVVKEEVKRAIDAGATDIYSVTARWIGGLLTNFPEVSKNFKKLKDITALLNNQFEKAKYTKKELSLFEKERQKLEIYYSGVSEMTKLPEAVFIIDTHLEDLAVREARAKGIPTIGITDTNADPTLIDYPIPANDDAAGSIKLITEYLVDAWIEGKTMKAESEKKEVAKEEKSEKKPEVKAEVSEEKTEKKAEAASEVKEKEKAPAKEEKKEVKAAVKKKAAKPKTTVKKK